MFTSSILVIFVFIVSICFCVSVFKFVIFSSISVTLVFKLSTWFSTLSTFASNVSILFFKFPVVVFSSFILVVFLSTLAFTCSILFSNSLEPVCNSFILLSIFVLSIIIPSFLIYVCKSPSGLICKNKSVLSFLSVPTFTIWNAGISVSLDNSILVTTVSPISLSILVFNCSFTSTLFAFKSIACFTFKVLFSLSYCISFASIVTFLFSSGIILLTLSTFPKSSLLNNICSPLPLVPYILFGCVVWSTFVSTLFDNSCKAFFTVLDFKDVEPGLKLISLAFNEDNVTHFVLSKFGVAICVSIHLYNPLL